MAAMSPPTRLALGVVLATTLLAPPARAQTDPPVIVLKAQRLFDGRGDAHARDAVLIVEGTRIKTLGARAAIPAGARVIELGDATLLPGLVDAHTHLSGESGDSWLQDELDYLRRTIPEQAIRSTQYARRTLLAGVTTVRDLGSAKFMDVGLRNSIAAGVVPGPRMLVAVNGLGSRGGHCDQSGYPYERFGKESGVAEGIASGPDGFRDAVRFAVKYGADVIKICATGGVLSLADEVDTPQLSQPEMNAIVEEAHRLRKRAAAHAHGAEGAKVAIRAGIDSIEHGSFLDREALQLMKDRGTYLVPTLMATEHVVSPKRSYPPEIAAKARAAAAARSATFRMAVKMGVKIAFGTDAAVGPHGANAEELALMVDHGMTPAATLRAATAGSAALLGIDKLTGTLEAGKEADVIAVAGDPLADIRQMKKVILVMKGGKLYLDPSAQR
jgi:imidazolonepropionase-like amidohydrolase